jgi:hypothetical protein
VPVRMAMSMRRALLACVSFLQENFSGQIFLPINVHVDLHGGNSASHHPHGFQTRTNIQRCDRLLEQFWRHAGIDQRTEEHIATNAGETVEISYSHK